MAKGSDNLKSWERQPKESLKAYEALYLYLQLGDERSTAKVAQQLGKSKALMDRWSSAWHWVQRSRDYDQELRRKEFADKKAEIKKMQERQMRTAQLLQKKAIEALDTLEPGSIEAKDILRFIMDGSKLEREMMIEALTEPTVTAEQQAKTSTSLADNIISAYRKRREGGEC